MKFGVLLCNKCHLAMGVSLQSKTHSCPHCNTKLKVMPDRIKYKRKSEKDLTAIISKLNQEFQSRQEGRFNSQNPDFGTTIIDPKHSGSNESEKDDSKSVYEHLDPFKRIAMKYKPPKNSIDFLTNIVTELCHELGEFTAEEFQQLLHACTLSVTKYDEYLEKLKDLDIIYEPRPGRFKLIEN